jgi:type VI protein secretion system component VasK
VSPLAGGWVALLIVYRMFDKTSTKTVAGAGEISTGIEWGIFFALLAALWLTWSGVAMRRAHRAEPALAEDPTVHLREQAPAPRERRAQRRAEPLAPVPARRERREEDERPHPPHRGVTREDAEQLSFDLPDDPRRD